MQIVVTSYLHNLLRSLKFAFLSMWESMDLYDQI
jgi:hypothetical protein